MKDRLVRYHMPGRPDWLILSETVPLGTVYEVLGYDRDTVLFNDDLQEAVQMDAYLVKGNNDMGWLPTVVFETIKED